MNESETINQQPAETEQPLVEATFVNRLFARILDFVIVAALYEILPRIGFFAGLAYLLTADGLFGGRSLGKKLLGLAVKVRDEAGAVSACGYKESTLRNFPFALALIIFAILKVIPVLGWLLSFVVLAGIVILEGLVLLGSENNMRLGDELAKTIVVEDKKRT